MIGVRIYETETLLYSSHNLTVSRICLYFALIQFPFYPFSVSSQDKFAIKPQNQAIVLGDNIIFKCRADPPNNRYMMWFEQLPGKNENKPTQVTDGAKIMTNQLFRDYSLDITDDNFDLHIEYTHKDSNILYGIYTCKLTRDGEKAARAHLVVLGE